MLLRALVLLKLLIVEAVVGESVFEAVESVVKSVEAVESVVVEAVDCCKLLCALESSSFVEAVELCCRSC